jgi:hypothetical protein
MTATRHANVHTHSSSSVIKNCHSYREMIAARDAVDVAPDLNASSLFDGEESGASVDNTITADATTATTGSGSSHDRENKAAEQLEAQRWAKIILVHLRRLLALDEGQASNPPFLCNGTLTNSMI